MVSIPKIKSQYITRNYNRVKNTASGITGEIKGTGSYFKNNAKTGWNNGARLSHIKHYNPLRSFWTKIVGSVAKTKVKQEHIPTILGGVGTFTPVPGGTIIGYGLGKVINKITNLFK